GPFGVGGLDYPADAPPGHALTALGRPADQADELVEVMSVLFCLEVRRAPDDVSVGGQELHEQSGGVRLAGRLDLADDLAGQAVQGLGGQSRPPGEGVGVSPYAVTR